MSEHPDESISMPSEPFGARAVRMGLATPEQVRKALHEQREGNARGERIRLGLLMVEMNIFTHEQLLDVLQDGEERTIPLCEDAIQLAARLRSIFTQPHTAIMFTSARHGEGVSRISRSVAHALTLMDEGQVLLVDANFRAPSLQPEFNASRSRPRVSSGVMGFSELLQNKATLGEVIRKSGTSSPSLLPIGDPAVDFVSLLLSEQCGRTLEALREAFHFVIIDSATLMDCPDPVLIAPHTDCVILVASAGKTRRAEILQMKNLLEVLNVPRVGVVLAEKYKPARPSRRRKSKSAAQAALPAVGLGSGS